MRRLLVALALMGSISNASAGDFDMPTLRGSDSVVPGPVLHTNWSGFYAGGQVSASSGNFDFSTTTVDLYRFMLRQLALEDEQHPELWQVLGKTDNQRAGYGGFVGYNSQWDDVVMGLEVGYTRTSFFANAPDSPLGRVTTAGGNTYDLTLDARANMAITDYLTTRVRAGYVLQNFMPYAAAGFVVGRADYTRWVSASGTETHPDGSVTPFAFTQSDAKNSALVYGWTAAIGLDILVLPNAFVRGEFEYTHFFPIANIQVGITTGRLAAGLRF